MTAPGRQACTVCGGPHNDIDVYPVGWREAFNWVRLTWRRRSKYHLETRRHAAALVARNARATADDIRHGRWREAKNRFNGYLAEPYHWPEGMKRCGSGWTHARALRSLERRARQPGVRWDLLQPALDEALGRRP